MANNVACTVLISDALLLDLKSAAQQWTPKETGGVLLGTWISNDTVTIKEIIGPGPEALHSSHSFTPDDSFHTSEIERVYFHSHGQVTYLGDWHTHPNAAAYLSKQDKNTLRKLASYPPARLDKPLMLILGTSPWSLTIFTHEFSIRKRSLFRVCSYSIVTDEQNRNGISDKPDN